MENSEIYHEYITIIPATKKDLTCAKSFGRGPRVVTGYQNQKDLPKLLDAMGEVGFSLEELKAFAGGTSSEFFGNAALSANASSQKDANIYFIIF